MTKKNQNRETWLRKASTFMCQQIFKPLGYTVPPVRVSVGFVGVRKIKAIGSCWSPTAAKDNVSQVFISPVVDDSVNALEILSHELIHALFPQAGHRGPFRKAAVAIGLVGKMTATKAGPELIERLNGLTKKIGDYPHAGLNIADFRKKKQSTRLLKAECSNCGYVVRLTKKWVDEVGLPRCQSTCGEDSFELAV